LRLGARAAANRIAMFLLFGTVVLLAIFIYGVSAYNRLIQLRVRSEAAWADIDVQLKRRHDLIPNLVETVKGYAAHERTTFERVTEARTRALAASGPAARAQAEGALTEALRGLFAVAENYPQLRAVQNFTQLQTQISETEDQIQLARRYYNAVVRDLNTRIAQFPTNLVAGLFNFQPREFFEAERESPQVQFRTSGT
jgi:LemA protein